jgi:hypothetical protein
VAVHYPCIEYLSQSRAVCIAKVFGLIPYVVLSGCLCAGAAAAAATAAAADAVTTRECRASSQT